MSDTLARAAVGVLGDDAEVVERAVESAGGRAVTGEPAAVLDEEPDAIVVAGDHALSALVATGRPIEVPVVPVAAGRGVRSVPRAAISPAVEALVAGEGDRVEFPIVAARVDGDRRARALADLMLVTAEPARISEYRVAAGADTVARFRADGVVVATPAGSHGYARRVDAPVVAAGTGVAAVAPVAPFATDPDHWVLPLADVEVTVERDEAPVQLLADDRPVGRVEPGEPISVTRDGHLPVLVLPESRDPFAVPE